MAPHRDELAAAYERVAALEARVDELEAPKKDAGTAATVDAEKTTPSVTHWSTGEPSTKDVVVGLLGGILVGLMGMALNVWQFTRIDLARHMHKPFMSHPAVMLVSLVSVVGLAVCLPRAYWPVALLSTRDESGTWSPGFQRTRRQWAGLALVFAVLNVLLFVVGPRFV
jgi:hypothetical protein